MRPRRKQNPKEEAAYFASMSKDKSGFDIRYINSHKGVFSCLYFEKGEFLLEYRGDLIGKEEYERRLRIYHDSQKVFMFEFRFNGKCLCVDAAMEDESLGRLVNDDHISPNSKMKTISVEGKPHLCLFATRDITPGEEITYNYGDAEWPWRCQEIPEGQSLPFKLKSSAMNTAVSQTSEMAGDQSPALTTASVLPPIQDMDQEIPEGQSEAFQLQASAMNTAVSQTSEMAGDQSPALTTASVLPPIQDMDQEIPEGQSEAFQLQPSAMNTAVSQTSEMAGDQTPALTTASVLPPIQDMDQEIPEGQSEAFQLQASAMNTAVSQTSEMAGDQSPALTTASVLPPIHDKDQENPEGQSEAFQLQPSAMNTAVSQSFIRYKRRMAHLREHHNSCLSRYLRQERSASDSSNSEDLSCSDKDYVPGSECESDTDSSLELEAFETASEAKGRNYLKARIAASKADLLCYEEHMTSGESDEDHLGEREVSLPSNIQGEQASSTQRSDSTQSVCRKPTSKLPMDTLGTVDAAHVSSLQSSVLDTEMENRRDGPDQCVQSSKISCSESHKNYCFVCGKSQSKISRHLETHVKEAEVAEALSFPKRSEKRRILLEKLRNKGNFLHNLNVLQSGTGSLKVKRKPNRECDPKQLIHCMYCKGMFVRKDLWRHSKRCSSKPQVGSEQTGRSRVLGMASMAECAFSQQVSQGVWKLLSAMKQDEIASAVRSDICVLQLAQSFFNKHGHDLTKHEYVRQKLRKIGRFLLTLRLEFSVYSLEEAVKPANFQKVVEAVKKVAGFSEEDHHYQIPSLALKLGHTLQKVCEILHCRALITEDEELIKSTEAFRKLYSTKWSELISHSALATLSEAKFNKPSTLPFTRDVQLLHKHLQETADNASAIFKKGATQQSYGELVRATLAQIIVFNRRRAGEVSKMQLKNFLERDRTQLHEDVAIGLTRFEQELCKHFSRVEIRGKRGRKVAVLLTPEMVDALNLFVSKRKECGVSEDNVFLFARPMCKTHYRGQDCLRLYAKQCGAKNPEHLRSTQLRKHVATLSQVLNLRENELDQVADFLGHDIRVHRNYYRLPEATTQLAKISKLLLAMEKGGVPSLRGKTLDDIEIEDEVNPMDNSDDEDESEPQTGDAANNASSVPRDMENQDGTVSDSKLLPKKKKTTPRKKTRISPRKIRMSWSNREVTAVMKHFKSHIRKGRLAAMGECEQCKTAEDPVLARRSAQNIRDFVRNRGIAFQRKRSVMQT